MISSKKRKADDNPTDTKVVDCNETSTYNAKRQKTQLVYDDVPDTNIKIMKYIEKIKTSRFYFRNLEIDDFDIDSWNCQRLDDTIRLNTVLHLDKDDVFVRFPPMKVIKSHFFPEGTLGCESFTNQFCIEDKYGHFYSGTLEATTQEARECWQWLRRLNAWVMKKLLLSTKFFEKECKYIIENNIFNSHVDLAGEIEEKQRYYRTNPQNLPILCGDDLVDIETYTKTVTTAVTKHLVIDVISIIILYCQCQMTFDDYVIWTEKEEKEKKSLIIAKYSNPLYLLPRHDSLINNCAHRFDNVDANTEDSLRIYIKRKMYKPFHEYRQYPLMPDYIEKNQEWKKEFLELTQMRNDLPLYDENDKLVPWKERNVQEGDIISVVVHLKVTVGFTKGWISAEPRYMQFVDRRTKSD